MMQILRGAKKMLYAAVGLGDAAAAAVAKEFEALSVRGKKRIEEQREKSKCSRELGCHLRCLEELLACPDCEEKLKETFSHLSDEQCRAVSMALGKACAKEENGSEKSE